MAEATPNVSIGEINQINCNAYDHHGKTSTRVKVEGGGSYLNKTKIKAEIYNHHEILQGDPLKDLYAHSATGALHSSDERVDAPRCHKETREAVQQDILSGVSHSDGSRGLIWLTGPAGGGKTAIVGSVCDRLKEAGRLAATFYFSSHNGSAARKSKRFFVTTLAYQFQAHPVLNEHIYAPMLSAIRRDPGIFDMDLKTQMDELILKPFRSVHGRIPSTADSSLIVAVDGVDECGEDPYNDPNRSREKDQVEVLSVILQAIQDPAFPCRIIIASRPEKCIRRFFNDVTAPPVVEIFLDDNYSPEKDIALFLRSSFARICRQHGYDPSAWPTERDIQKLVLNASGQFIYAATVLRFVDSDWPLPKVQLDLVLKVKARVVSNPFHALDALYTMILNASPTPQDTVLWLKALQAIARRSDSSPRIISAWTIDRLLESSDGQSRTVLGIPSLIYRAASHGFLDVNGGPLNKEDYVVYSFYHKSFLDFIEDAGRSEAAFPEINAASVDSCIWQRIAKVLECDGPEVQIDAALLPMFRKCFMNLWANEIYHDQLRAGLPRNLLDNCDPASWIRPGLSMGTLRLLYIHVHSYCHFYTGCRNGCRLWRELIWTAQFQVETCDVLGFARFDLLLDRLFISRLQL